MPPNPVESQDTPLRGLHAEWNGRITDFAGWRLPLSYPSGTLSEHNAARNGAVLFDVSHMAQIVLRGEQAANALSRVLPADIAALAPGKSKYAVMLNSSGGAIDDLIVANDGARGFFIVANAARRQEDLAHLRQNLPPNCQPEEITNRALIAVQGPQAAAAIAPMLPESGKLRFMESEWQTMNEFNSEVRVSRTGYTGEDGFEISIPAEHAESFCRVLVGERGVQPAGLGARDTLRIEAALCLYGHELNETISPIEAGLAWTIPKARRESGEFIGCESIRGQLQEGAPRKLVGVHPEGRSILRAGTPLKNESGEGVGEISSGVFSPTLQIPIALGFIRTPAPDIGQTVFAEARGKTVPCKICRTPFVPHRYAVNKP